MDMYKTSFTTLALPMLFVVLSFLNISCEPDHSVTLIYPDGGASVSITTSSKYGDFPVPAFTTDGGVLGAVATYTKLSTYDMVTKYGVGELYSGVGTKSCVYGGIFTLGKEVVDTIHSSVGPIYIAPNRHDIGRVLDINFENPEAVTFGLSSGSAGLGVIDTMTMPTVSKITSIPYGAMLSGGADLTIDWTGSTGLDNLTLFVSDATGHGVSQVIAQDRGRITIPAWRLSGVKSGPGYIMLVKYRSHLKNLLRHTIATFGETVYRVDVTWK